MPDERKAITLRLEPELLDALDRWREGQRVPPERHATIVLALTEFLEREGALPVTRRGE